MCYQQLQREKSIKNMGLFCFVSSLSFLFLVLKIWTWSLFYNFLKNILLVRRIKMTAFEGVQQMHSQKMVLTEPILETKNMGLIFHKNGKKTKNGIKEETG